MNTKILFLVILGTFILLAAISFIFLWQSQVNTPEQISQPEHRYYQGPVPEGYDEQHFRETGITKPLEVKE